MSARWRDRWRKQGDAVKSFDSVKALNDASKSGLASGYYSVPDVGVTYWDGAAIFPY